MILISGLHLKHYFEKLIVKNRGAVVVVIVW